MPELNPFYRQLRGIDPDRALLSLLARPDRRERLWGLFLFNQEIARVRETVTDTTLGLIRLQWWRDRLAALYNNDMMPLRDHPLLPHLASAIVDAQLGHDDFETLLYAREFDLSGVLPANVGGVVNYADFTNTPLLRMALQIAGQEATHPALPHIAIAYGMTGLMRAVPYHAAQERSFLPADKLEAQGVTPEQLYAGKAATALPGAVQPVLEEALRQLDIGQSVGPTALPPMLKGAVRVARLHAGIMRKSGYDPARADYYRVPFAYNVRVLASGF